MDARRIVPLNSSSSPRDNGPVLYWMSRDQRTQDNYALLTAAHYATRHAVPLGVLFCLAPSFGYASPSHFSFMLAGLAQVKERLAERGIPFFMLSGQPDEQIPAFVRQVGASLLVSDFDPLRIKRFWRESVAARIDIPHIMVDAHNIIPVWQTSGKCEYAARTIRPKVHRLLPEYLTDIPPMPERFKPWSTLPESIFPDFSPAPFPVISGEDAAHARLTQFMDDGFLRYAERNDPNADATSGLSPYLHFGQISAQRVALCASLADAAPEAKESFLEELVVRRELADNFCHYNPQYDSADGMPPWARQTLQKHMNDRREYIYTYEEFETENTHDPLWNAAQKEMTKTGIMHGFMRMYWCKKILEWSQDAETAMQTAIRLNDTYSLDGRDPNGYTGIAWSIYGVHDRPWGERPVYGTIRCMTYGGCRRKFDVDLYIQRMETLSDALSNGDGSSGERPG